MGIKADDINTLYANVICKVSEMESDKDKQMEMYMELSIRHNLFASYIEKWYIACTWWHDQYLTVIMNALEKKLDEINLEVSRKSKVTVLWDRKKDTQKNVKEGHT